MHSLLHNADVRASVTRDPVEFAERTRAFLARRPIEHNLLATVVATLEPGDCTDPPLFAWVQADAGGDVLGAVLRTPPRHLLASSMSAQAAGVLMPKLLEVDPELPGVNGPESAAAYLAEAWRGCTGGTVEVGMSLAIYWLAHVEEPPRQPTGHSRTATPSDRELAIEWMRAFNREAGVVEANVEFETARRLGDGRLFFWEDRRVVSMVGTSPPAAGVVRLGPVYTPRAARRHGYATALVADVSRRTLAAGATRCMLYTDLAHTTSNSIYQAVGYRRSNDATEYHFSSG